MGVAAVCQTGEERVGFPLLPEVFYGGEGHIELGIGQLFPAGEMGEVLRGVHDGVQPAHVGDHDGGTDFSLGGQTDGLLEILGGSSGGANDMGGGIVAVVQVDAGGKGLVRGAGEEVHTPVIAQQPVPHLCQRADGVVDENIVVAPAAGEGHQFRVLVGAFSGVHVHQPDAVRRGQGFGNQPAGPGDALAGKVRHHDHGGLFLQS